MDPDGFSHLTVTSNADCWIVGFSDVAFDNFFWILVLLVFLVLLFLQLDGILDLFGFSPYAFTSRALDVGFGFSKDTGSNLVVLDFWIFSAIDCSQLLYKDAANIFACIEQDCPFFGLM